MARTVRLTDRDIDYISRVVDTEVPRSIERRSPSTYRAMVNAVVDTVTNRIASPSFPKTTTDVLNQKRAFSKIAGPKRLDPYGTVQNAPEARKALQNMVREHIENRVVGEDSSIGNAVNYANPNFSDRSNLRGWINPMIEAGATALGLGNAIHFHGTAPGTAPADDYSVSLNGVDNSGPLSRVPTPQFADRAGTGINQSDSATGIMAAVNPASTMSVTRSPLASPTMALSGSVERGMTPAAASSGLLSYSGPTDAASLQARANLDRQRLQAQNGSLDLTRAQTADAMKRRDAALGVLGKAPVNNAVSAINAVSPLAPTAAPKTNLANAYGQMADTMGQAGVLGLSGQKVLDPNDILGVGKLAPSPIGTLPVESMPEVQPVAGPATAEVVNSPRTTARRAAGTVGGLLSPDEYGMVAKQQMNLNAQGVNRKAQLSSALRNGAGAFGGGLLGGLVAGPIGALLGGYLGNQFMNNVTTTNGFPAAPKGPVYGDGKQTDYGRSVQKSSGQYRSAVSKGSVGLY